MPAHKFVTPIVEHLHLYPMFEELEQGLCASAVEMARLLDNNVCLEHIYPQYFEKKYYEKRVEFLKQSKSQKEACSVRRPASCTHSHGSHETCSGNSEDMSTTSPLAESPQLKSPQPLTSTEPVYTVPSNADTVESPPKMLRPPPGFHSKAENPITGFSLPNTVSPSIDMRFGTASTPIQYSQPFYPYGFPQNTYHTNTGPYTNLMYMQPNYQTAYSPYPQTQTYIPQQYYAQQNQFMGYNYCSSPMKWSDPGLEQYEKNCCAQLSFLQYEKGLRPQPTSQGQYEKVLRPQPTSQEQYEKDLRAQPTYHKQYEKDLRPQPTYHKQYEKDLRTQPTSQGQYEKDLCPQPTYHKQYEKDLRTQPTSQGQYEKDLRPQPTYHEQYEKDLCTQSTSQGQYEKDLRMQHIPQVQQDIPSPQKDSRSPVLQSEPNSCQNSRPQSSMEEPELVALAEEDDDYNDIVEEYISKLLTSRNIESKVDVAMAKTLNNKSVKGDASRESTGQQDSIGKPEENKNVVDVSKTANSSKILVSDGNEKLAETKPKKKKKEKVEQTNVKNAVVKQCLETSTKQELPETKSKKKKKDKIEQTNVVTEPNLETSTKQELTDTKDISKKKKKKSKESKECQPSIESDKNNSNNKTKQQTPQSSKTKKVEESKLDPKAVESSTNSVTTNKKKNQDKPILDFHDIITDEAISKQEHSDTNADFKLNTSNISLIDVDLAELASVLHSPLSADGKEGLQWFDCSTPVLVPISGNQSENSSHYDQEIMSETKVIDDAVKLYGKYVVEAVLAGKVIHLIWLDNELYAIINEVLKSYTSEDMSIVAVRKYLINRNVRIPLKDIDLETLDETVKSDIERCKLNIHQTRWKSMHLIPLTHLAEFAKVFNVYEQFKNFEQFVNTVKSTRNC